MSITHDEPAQRPEGTHTQTGASLSEPAEREAFLAAGEGWFSLTGAGVLGAVRHAGGAASDVMDRARNELVDGVSGERLALRLGDMDDEDLLDTLLDVAWLAGQDGVITAAQRVFITRVCEKVGLPRPAAATLCDVALPDETGAPPADAIQSWRKRALHGLWGKNPVKRVLKPRPDKIARPPWLDPAHRKRPGTTLPMDGFAGMMANGSAINIVRPAASSVIVAATLTAAAALTIGAGAFALRAQAGPLFEEIEASTIWWCAWAATAAAAMLVTWVNRRSQVRWYAQAEPSLRVACHALTKGLGRGDSITVLPGTRWIQFVPEGHDAQWILALSANRDRPSFLRLAGEQSESAVRALRQQGIEAFTDSPGESERPVYVAELPQPRDIRGATQALDAFFGRLRPNNGATTLELTSANNNPLEPLTRRAVARAAASGWKATPVPATTWDLGRLVSQTIAVVAVSWSTWISLDIIVGPSAADFTIPAVASIALVTLFVLVDRITTRASTNRRGPLRDRRLVVEDNQLSWLGERERPIVLTKPFRLSITVDPMSAGDDLHGLAGIELLQSLGGETAKMRFRVPAQVGASCPRLQTYALTGPVVDGAALADNIWPAIRYWSAMHGRPALVDIRRQIRRMDEPEGAIGGAKETVEPEPEPESAGSTTATSD